MQKYFILFFCLFVPFSVSAHADTTDTKEVVITDESFRCLSDMEKVRHFYVDNLLGDLDATLEVANSKKGGVYPPGSVVQLVPQEVMVKREEGWNPKTKDWEFFELNVSAEGSSIKVRGADEVFNRFGGNCLECHQRARPQWDMICEQGHGCLPIPLTRQKIRLIQDSDPRCLSED
ncbi:hypothetical protein GCM10017044_15690 [Kordiimonas sediminis]|uniref:Cytochrome P460 domain-containing protein n=1 Tax=Kordiimonas sediminis TaxID=1735581 RepID=A0A919AQQ3_9PROT|nr:hypothetical protein [Kordiimonas sediminis]GHF22380.1 hypothetical protein GCM10017044_15690 [Kordiimonas sediminis]